jgi:predicted neuraminidase
MICAEIEGRMRRTTATAVFLLVVIVVFLPPLYRGLSRDLSWSFALPGPSPAAGRSETAAFYREAFVEQEELTRSVHCPGLAEMGDGNLFAVWYGGKREGSSDVALYQSVWDRQTGVWASPCLMVDAAQTQADLQRYVRKLGNAVLLNDSHGALWLFYVSVSLGGWSGSAINFRVSKDDGCHWSKTRRLVTSPVFNMGTLVRGAPFLYADGSIGLPVYHELLSKWGELVRVGSGGSVLDASTITRDRVLLQPSVVPLDATHAVAFMRNSGEASRRILMSATSDGGRVWSAPERMPLPNPDSAVSGLRARDGTVWLVFNNMDIDRDDLSLAGSLDGGVTWRVVHAFEREIASEEEETPGFSYPYLTQARDGVFHLLYTWNRRRIKHVSFNESWLKKLQ